MSERLCAFICLCDKGRTLLRDALVPVVVHCCWEHNDWLQFVSRGWTLSDMKDHQLTALSGAQRQTEKFLRSYQTERGISSVLVTMKGRYHPIDEENMKKWASWNYLQTISPSCLNLFQKKTHFSKVLTLKAQSYNSLNTTLSVLECKLESLV